MAALLEAPITTEIIPETATIGRFFDPDTPYESSERFENMHHDLLPAEVGVVLQIGRTENGKLVNFDIELSDEDTIVDTVALIFDAREQEKGVFHWQLSEAEATGKPPQRDQTPRGSTIRQLTVTQGGTTAVRYLFDANGLRRHNAEMVDPVELTQVIVELLADPTRARFLERVLRKTHRATQELGKLMLEEVDEMAPTLLDKKIAKKEKQLHESGFTPLKPYKPSPMAAQLLIPLISSGRLLR